MRRFVIFFTVALFVAFVGAVYWVGDILTKPSRVETGSPPTDLDGHTLTFRSGTGTTLSGWFFPGISGRGAILLLHTEFIASVTYRSLAARADAMNSVSSFSIALVPWQVAKMVL